MEAFVKFSARTIRLKSLSAGAPFRMADESDVLLKTSDVIVMDHENGPSEIFNTCRLKDGQLLDLHEDTAVVRLCQIADAVFEDHA